MDPIISKLLRLETYKATPDPASPRSVLIADDERGILHLLAMFLKSLGHHVIATADNGETAVALAKSHRPDLIILDVEMPRLDGLDAARAILVEDSVPIILSTGRSDDDVLARSRAVNIQAHLVKPFSKEQLKTAIAIAISQHQALLAANLRTDELSEELAAAVAIERGVNIFIKKFGIDRKEALEKLETAARVRHCSLTEVCNGMREIE